MFVCCTIRSFFFFLFVIIPINLIFHLSIDLFNRFSFQNQPCPPGHFVSASNQHCVPHFDCSIQPFARPYVWLVNGTVKQVRLVRFDHELVVVSTPTNPSMVPDFQAGLQLSKQFDQLQLQTQFTSTFLGACANASRLYTRYEPLGDALNAHELMKDKKFAFAFNRRLWQIEENSDTAFVRTLSSSLRCFQLCLSYLSVIDRLHSSLVGVRVMCDGNDLHKLLTQFLLKSPHELILNDLDALPNASNNQKVVCGSKPLVGNLVAPEQRSANASYDEKIDIWRIPDVCWWFLKGCESNVLLFNLISVELQKCKQTQPNRRPTARHLLNRFQSINHTLFYEFLSSFQF